MTRTRNADLTNTRLLWRFEQPKIPQAVPNRKKPCEVTEPVYLRDSAWSNNTEWPHCGLLVAYTLFIGLVACAAVWWGNYWG